MSSLVSFTAAGCKLSISASQPATHDQTGFAALTYTEVKEVTDLGQGYSRAYNPVEYKPLSNREVQTRKGSYSSGNATVTYAKVDADPGQTIMRAAAASDNAYSFKLEYQNGDVDYFLALVMGNPKNIGSIDNIVMRTSEIRIVQGGIVEVIA